MFRLRLAQAFLGLLWFCLIFGIYRAIRDKAFSALAIGFCMNLLWQYAMLIVIRQQKAKLAQTVEG